ncbi:MAG: hypothetical protein H6656_18740 [Ardenticatenaceae bacterium]|nr:hypothetical protein [Ardenticatenaceae bacterium]
MMKGDRRSSKRGTSIEFADYRNYTKGDDCGGWIGMCMPGWNGRLSSSLKKKKI